MIRMKAYTRKVIFAIACMLLAAAAMAQRDTSCYIRYFIWDRHHVRLEIANRDSQLCEAQTRYRIRHQDTLQYVIRDGRRMYIKFFGNPPADILQQIASAYDDANDPVEYGEPFISARIIFIVDTNGTALSQGVGFPSLSKYFNRHLAEAMKTVSHKFEPVIVDGKPVLSLQEYWFARDELNKYHGK